MGVKFNPYQGPQYPASLPPPSLFGGLAVGMSQGMPSDASNWFDVGSGQVSRRGRQPWKNEGRRTRLEKKADEKKEKKKEEKPGE